MSYLPSVWDTTPLQCTEPKRIWDAFYGSDGTITVEEEHFSHILVHAAVLRPLEYHSAVRVQLHRLICSQFYHSAEQDSSIALSAFFTLLEFLDRLVKFCNQICFNGFLKERYNQREYREVVRNRWFAGDDSWSIGRGCRPRKLFQ